MTFLCGADGFAIFAPYLALFLVTIYLFTTRKRRLAAQPVPVEKNKRARR